MLLLPLLFIACGSHLPLSLACLVDVIVFVFTVWCAVVNYCYLGFTEAKTDILAFCDFLNATEQNMLQLFSVPSKYP